LVQNPPNSCFYHYYHVQRACANVNDVKILNTYVTYEFVSTLC
jgi:hypothetical protein